MAIDKLEKDIKEEKLNNIYLLHGTETYLLENTIKKIKKIFGEIVQGINYIMIDENNLNTLISELETPSFGFEKKLIIVRNSGLFKKEGKKKNLFLEELIKKISNYIYENELKIKENNILIFIEYEIEKNELYKIIDKKGEIFYFEQEKMPQLKGKIGINSVGTVIGSHTGPGTIALFFMGDERVN